MFNSKKVKTESFPEKRQRIMLELTEKLDSLQGSETEYRQSGENLEAWNDRIDVLESTIHSTLTPNLAFLKEQAIINRDLAQEAYDREKARYEKTVKIRTQAQESLAQLDRISLLAATQQKAQVNRTVQLHGEGLPEISPLRSEMQRELDHAEYYIQALTELTLEK